jgi:AcrR family transcriptional regulator
VLRLALPQAGENAMIDQATARGRIISAALNCAAAGDWRSVTLSDIAEAASLSLADLSKEFDTKTAILAALVGEVDRELLNGLPRRTEGQEVRDALFDVVMTRFDILAPHKRALKSIHGSGPADLSMATALLRSMRWVLEAAGISTDGHVGSLRVAGLAAVYTSVFRTWLDDDDPGLARTMAALDRRLRGGERALRNVERVSSIVGRLVKEGPAFIRSAMRRPPAPEQARDPDAGTV